jgi:nucleoside 2-deoxyribosyltransferase
MSPALPTCPLCGLEAPLATISPRADQDVNDVQCKRCGNFAVCPGHVSLDWNRGHVPTFLRGKGVAEYDIVRANALMHAYLSIYTRECTERRTPAEVINLVDAVSLERLAETYANTPVATKLEKLLRLIEKRTSFPGQPVQFTAPLDYPALHAVKPEEASYYLRALGKAGLIEVPVLESLPQTEDGELQIDATITPAGWERLGSHGKASRTAFVAMSFDARLNSAFSDGIEPAIREAGYDPLRVDRVHHNEKICDRIVAEIRRARFMVADVTMQKQGVYFEAGFAMALGLPVIWSCHRDDLTNVHFDTRQYNHIVWEAPADLKQQLLDRIEATIGTVH